MSDGQEERRRADATSGGLRTRTGARLRRVAIDPTPKPRKRTLAGLQQELRREVDARQLLGEPRPSKDDEQALTAEIRRREHAQRVEEWRAEAAEVDRRVVDALTALERVREKTRGSEHETMKRIDQYARRLLAQLKKLRAPAPPLP